MKHKGMKSDALTNFVMLSCVLLLIGFVIAIGFYRLTFNGGISSNSSDWSNLGGYIGGIFSPLVSFVTLLAVLKTVFLQRTLLDAQAVEFERMHKLQQDTFDSQQVQLKAATIQAQMDTIERARFSVLSMIDRWVTYFENKLGRSTDGLNSIAGWAAAGTNKVDFESAQKIAKNNNDLRETILSLMALSQDISLNSYDSAEDLRDYYHSEISKILVGPEVIPDNSNGTIAPV